MPCNLKVHLVFHVSRLKKLLGAEDHLVTPQELIEVKDLTFVPHEYESILGALINNLRT